MTPCRHCRRNPDTPAVHRHVTLHGTREDALEHLPRFCTGERLELGTGSISLVCGRTRVDVRIVAETGLDAARAEAPLVLLALAFEGRSDDEADGYVNRLRHRARLSSHCH